MYLVEMRKSRAQAEQNRIAQQEANDKKARFHREIDHFEHSLQEMWPVRHVREGYLQREYLMMASDQRQLRMAKISLREDLLVEWSDPVSIASVVSVELQQKSTTIIKLDTTATTKKTGGLGRAVIGGALFGGVGAIVGAASAGSKTAATTTSTSQTTNGPVWLVIGTTDMIRPVIKTHMKSKHEGEQWLHRMRGTLALIAQE